LSGNVQRLRIIGGLHRGRILDFKPAEGLRPTPDRVRETLFNWLQPVIEGATCLDLFAGSGALGLEAASRGAADVVWVDSNTTAGEQIKSHIKTLGLDHAEVVMKTAQTYLDESDKGFDVVFLDPPYRKGLLQTICGVLEEKGLLKQNARIYLESEVMLEQDKLPDGWQLTHQKRAGQVFYHLALKR